MDIAATFEKFEDEYLKFERVEQPMHPRPDICAFLLLDKLCPKPGSDLIAASEHDEFFLAVDFDLLAEVATEDDIRTLVRCGVMYSEEYDYLSMYA